jgi:hypothetical protein
VTATGRAVAVNWRAVVLIAGLYILAIEILKKADRPGSKKSVVYEVHFWWLG